jgi:uncharacterized protein (DUF58 family)
MPYWLRSTLKIWSQYLAIAIASIPAGILGVALMAAGLSEVWTLLICIALALVLGLGGWFLVETIGFRIERYSRYGEKGYAWQQALRLTKRSKERFRLQMQKAWEQKRFQSSSKLIRHL